MRPGRQVTDRLKIADVPNYLLTTTGVERKVWVIYHWIRVGKRSYSNRTTKLKTESICGQKFTRESWVNQFVKELEE